MAESLDTTDDEFAGIPDMPSDDELRADILRTGGPAYWRPFGGAQGEPTRFAEISEKAAEKVLEARLTAGPGPNGNALQWAYFEQHQTRSELQKEAARLREKLVAIAFIDPETKEETPAVSDPTQRRRLEIELSQAEAQIIRLSGKAGQIKLEKALAKAVHARKVAHKNAYELAEAKRRANAETANERIERLKDGFKKKPKDDQ